VYQLWIQLARLVQPVARLVQVLLQAVLLAPGRELLQAVLLAPGRGLQRLPGLGRRVLQLTLALAQHLGCLLVARSC
jgi:hypothetical protein